MTSLASIYSQLVILLMAVAVVLLRSDCIKDSNLINLITSVIIN
jgi:hypothetical protein